MSAKAQEPLRRKKIGVSAKATAMISGAVTVTTEQSERVVNDAPKLLETFSPGDVSHQGDIIIVCLSRMPRSAKPRKSRQLADGTTQGSRHVLKRGDVFDADPSEVMTLIAESTGIHVEHAYIGPVFVSPDAPTKNDLTHPEHGNQGFPAKSICAVVYQRNLDAEERAQRAQD